MKKAHNAVLALARAMYGKRLTQKQYSEMLSLKNPNEFAAYLKTRTPYSQSFEGLNISSFTEEIIIDRVEKLYLSRFVKFCRLQSAIGLSFYKYFAHKQETERILSCVMNVLSEKEDEGVIDIKYLPERHSSIDFWALAKAKSLEEIARVLEKTEYSKVFERCVQSSMGNYFVFETAFNSLLTSLQQQIIKDCFTGKERKAVYEAMSIQNDIEFIGKLTRIIRYYGMQTDIRTALTPTKMTLFTEKQIKQLLSAETLEELTAALKKTPYKKLDVLSGEVNIRAVLDSYLYKYYRKQIRFSVYPCVVMYSYMQLLRFEADNIIKILQGNRYSLSAEEITENLVLD